MQHKAVIYGSDTFIMENGKINNETWPGKEIPEEILLSKCCEFFIHITVPICIFISFVMVLLWLICDPK